MLPLASVSFVLLCLDYFRLFVLFCFFVFFNHVGKTLHYV